MKTLSLTARISLLFAVAAALVLLTTGYFLTQVVQAHFKDGDRHELDGKLALIQNLLEHDYGAQASTLLPQQLRNALVGHHDLSLMVLDGTGNAVFATPGAAFPRALLQDCLSRPQACRPDQLRQWEQAGVSYRGFVAPVRAADGTRYTVALSLDIQHHVRFMNTFRSVLAIAIALAALATAGLGWAVTRWGLFPLRRVTDTIAGISSESLTERLPATGLPTELQPLATAFNAMLARLDASFRRLSDFSSNIAHELRTPISNLMTQTQVALSGARSNEAYKEILYSSLEEYERMAQMVGDMLYLAQADNGLLKPQTQTVDLDTETQDLIDYFEAWAEERGVALATAGSARVAGDRLMLRRALSNLLSNAITHTPPGQRVHVSLVQAGDKATVSIENPGPDIPAEHLPRLFDRFYRVDPSRQRNEDGSGLGLAIVKSIVEAHGGTITVTSAGQTTRFQITLPAVAE